MITHTFSSKAQRTKKRFERRRGVIGILSMMFMVLFGSLAVAMAITSKGNLRTADAHLRVTRALSSTDTGMAIAAARLMEATRTFRIEKGEIDAAFAMDLWNGTFSLADGKVILPSGDDATFGVRELLLATHATDATVAIAPYYTAEAEWAVTDPIILERASDNPASLLFDQIVSAAQITYIPIAADGSVRVVVTGYDWDWTRESWVERSAQKDFRVLKRVDQAILGASKIMIGKNVLINGPLGARYTGTGFVEGHPIVIKSDFLGLDAVLDAKLQAFTDTVITSDLNGDNRLATQHAVENAQIANLNAMDFDNDVIPDGDFVDTSGDYFLDEFDVFINHFDGDDDGRLVLGNALTAGTPADGQAPEFDAIDDELALLLDGAVPDRNNDGVVDSKDVVLGYRDGVIDYKDRYAKIRGPVLLRADRAGFEAVEDNNGVALGDYRNAVQGPIVAGDEQPFSFDVGEDKLPDPDFNTFDTATAALSTMANGAGFAAQAGVGGAVWTPVINAEGAIVGQQFNLAVEMLTELSPYGVPPTAGDFYERPVFRDVEFKDVVIPAGLNALFVNCTFAGVTRVQTTIDNAHPAWQFYGKQNEDGSLQYPPLPDDSSAQLDNEYYPVGDPTFVRPPDFDVPRLQVGGVKYVNTKPLSNNIRFHDCTFVGSIVADKPDIYTHLRNKLQFTGSTKFYTEHPQFPDDPDLNPEPGDLDEIVKSSMLLPHYSVDIGSNNAPASQDVNLSGVIIAGVIDVRGDTTINGALLLTFAPQPNDPALMHFGQPAGNPAKFNITLGYFSPDQGDEEGYPLFEFGGQLVVGFDTNADGLPDEFDPGSATGVPVPFNGFGRVVINWDPNLVMPDGLVAPVQVEALKTTYREGKIGGIGGM